MNRKINFDDLKELAELDFEGEKKHDLEEGALPKIRRAINVRTAIRAGRPTIVGLAAAN